MVGHWEFFPIPMHGSLDVHLGAFAIFKSSWSRCNYSCFSIFFSIFRFICCRGKFLVICFCWWYFIVDRNELKCFLKRSLQCNFISVIVIAGLPRARSARGTEPHTHGIWSTSFRLVVTWLTKRTYASTDCTGGVGETIKRKGGVSQACLSKSTSFTLASAWFHTVGAWH